jgi:hypothetical protein
MRRILVAVTIGAATLVVAGCGDSTPTKGDPEKAALELKQIQDLRKKEGRPGK